MIAVALLAEGVDRNQYQLNGSTWKDGVALLAEGVDRNRGKYHHPRTEQKSPSSRRAWIEILSVLVIRSPPVVALLAEGVDRNNLAV